MLCSVFLCCAILIYYKYHNIHHGTFPCSVLLFSSYWPIRFLFLCTLKSTVYVLVFKGSGWEHVPTDVPSQSISMGSNHRVWTIASNGTAYFRAGFSANKKTGTVNS